MWYEDKLIEDGNNNLYFKVHNCFERSETEGWALLATGRPLCSGIGLVHGMMGGNMKDKVICYSTFKDGVVEILYSDKNKIKNNNLPSIL